MTAPALTPSAAAFCADIQRARARHCMVYGYSFEDAAAEGTALAEAFEAAMSSEPEAERFIASIDGLPCVFPAAPARARTTEQLTLGGT
jgi:hypothetical protein